MMWRFRFARATPKIAKRKDEVIFQNTDQGRHSKVLYMANRDTANYINKCRAEICGQHVMISLIGGLGFLHTINRETKKLCLVDGSAVQAKYAQLVISLIRKSRDIYHFLSLVSGRKILSEEPLSENCMTHERISHADFINENMTKHECEIYQQTILRFYESWKLDYFSPVDFKSKPKSFFWLFGEQNPYSRFKNQKTFQELQFLLASIETHYHVSKLEELDYGLWQEQDLATYVLVSNADSSRYTRGGDLIFNRIIATMKAETQIHYLSWGRFATLDSGHNHADAIRKLLPHTKGRSIVQTITHAGHSFSQDELDASEMVTINIDEAFDFSTKRYWEDCFLFHISCPKSCKNKKEKMQTLFSKLAGIFTSVIILDHAEFTSPGEWMEWLRAVQFHHSYFITKIEFSGGGTGFRRNFLMVWTLRGMHEIHDAAFLN